MEFGQLVKELRLKQNYTLRAFCREYNYDPGNWSKMERGVLPPPQSTNKLRQFAEQLGITYGSDEWQTFIDLASVENGIIPIDLMEDSEIVKRLPMFFQMLRRTKPNKEDLDRIIEIISKNP